MFLLTVSAGSVNLANINNCVVADDDFSAPVRLNNFVIGILGSAACNPNNTRAEGSDSI